MLALLPLLLKILQDILHIAVPDSEAVLVNLVFLFFCFAGIITWRAEKHLSLASLLEKTSGKVKLVLSKFRSFATLFVLTVLFFDSLCQLVNPAQLANKIWGISLKFVFLFLPLCYASLIFLSFAKKNDRLFSFLGFFAGLFASAGTLGREKGRKKKRKKKRGKRKKERKKGKKEEKYTVRSFWITSGMSI